ncbi:COG4315 family predicted lipoprotein [Streptomyces chartreusis]|uniref:COG4315 family predicted lipoprotein n=1 Tax=Streptomyces chartreusis TaxID=1969 RepID=UPI0038282FEF
MASAATVLLALSGCSASQPTQEKDGSAAGTKGPGSSAPAATVSVKTANSSLGRILVDGSGRTLYGFTKDQKGKAGACDADCIAVWPALTSPTVAEDGANASLVGKIRLAEGAEQAVYGDWPLYYYVGDATPGDVSGQGLDGEWFVIRPDGKLIKQLP